MALEHAHRTLSHLIHVAYSSCTKIAFCSISYTIVVLLGIEIALKIAISGLILTFCAALRDMKISSEFVAHYNCYLLEHLN